MEKMKKEECEKEKKEKKECDMMTPPPPTPPAEVKIILWLREQNKIFCMISMILF